MAQPTFDQFMWAIGQQESGGNYSVVNSYGAVGKYQVLKSNIPGWSRQVLGHSITWQQYRDSPKLQEQIVRGILKGYYDKWGARGAAAAWYAGPGNHDLDMSTRSQPGGPSIKGYVDQVLGRIKGYTGGTTAGTPTATSGGGGATVASRDELAEQYGFVEALMNSNPELKAKFREAAKNQWTAEKFQAEIRDTKWWKAHSETERQFLVLRYGDPKTANQKLAQAKVRVRQLANQLGLIENSANLKSMNTWAYNLVAKGWDEAQLRAEIGKSIRFTGLKLEGEAGEHFQALRSYAYSMGVTMANSWYGTKSRAIIRGIGTEQDFKNEIAKQAKSLYPDFAKQIDAGQTVMDIASPYVQTMQNILEIPAGSVSLQDSAIKSALQNKNSATGQSEIMPLWQFENKLRSDPRWNKTQNAQNSMMQVAHQVLADFGVKY